MVQPSACLVPPKFLKFLHGLSLSCLRLASNKLLKMREREKTIYTERDLLRSSAGHQVYSLPKCSKDGWYLKK